MPFLLCCRLSFQSTGLLLARWRKTASHTILKHLRFCLSTYAVRALRLQGLKTATPPITNTLHVQKPAARGRLGRMLLRGYLQEGDGKRPERRNYLVNANTVQTDLDNAWERLEDGLGTAANMALISGTGPF